MKSHTLELVDLVVGREDAALTAPITLTLEGGSLLAIHGSNGAGKSTLLKTVAGLLRPVSGKIRVNGAWPAATPPLYAGHKRGLTPSLSVYDNVAFWARAAGCPELIPAALHYFDLSDIPDATVESLSAGWQQRVALTRLITMQASLWLLDEPTSNLDAGGVELLHRLIETRLEQGGMVLIASHHTLDGPRVRKLALSANACV